jgi:hypothetical protein
MKPIIISCLIILALAGCATYKGVGSQTWHDQRTAELEQARKDQKITEAEYQNSKNQIDQIRVNYLRRDDSPVHTSFGFGWWH